jgi:hypothetical protein
MSKTGIFILLSMFLVMLSACQVPAPTADTRALEARVAALEAQLNGVDGAANAGDVAALTNRITVLEEVVALASSGGMTMDHDEETVEGEEGVEHGTEAVAMSSNPMFDVTLAMHIMDTAGFHSMDDRINGESAIDATYLGTVNRVVRLISVTPWSPELAEEATTFQATLVEFATVLESGDVEAAKPLATLAHEEQHAFSHSIETWLNGQMGMEGEGDHSH